LRNEILKIATEVRKIQTEAEETFSIKVPSVLFNFLAETGSVNELLGKYQEAIDAIKKLQTPPKYAPYGPGLRLPISNPVC
jgi:hypothetical protein